MTYTPDDPDGALTRYAAAYRAIEERGDLLTTALEQQREDQAMGAAWRRAEAALPEGWRPLQVSVDDDDWTIWWATTVTHAFFEGENDHDAECVNADGPTPTAALIALAEKLEGMK